MKKWFMGNGSWTVFRARGLRTIFVAALLSLTIPHLPSCSARSPQPGRLVAETGSNVISGTKNFLGANLEIAPATAVSNPVPLHQAQSLISTGGLSGTATNTLTSTNQLTTTSNTLATATALKLDITSTNNLVSTNQLTATSNTLAAALITATNANSILDQAYALAQAQSANATNVTGGTTNLATVLATGPNPGHMGGLIQSNGTLASVTITNPTVLGNFGPTNNLARTSGTYGGLSVGFATTAGSAGSAVTAGTADNALNLGGIAAEFFVTNFTLVTATNANSILDQAYALAQGQSASATNQFVRQGGDYTNGTLIGSYIGNGTAQVHTTSLYGGLAYKPFASPALSQNNTWWAFTNIAGAFVPEYSLYVMGMDVLGRRFVLLGNQTPVGNTDTFNAEVDSDWIMHIAFGSVAPLNEDARFTIAGLLNKAPLGLKHYRGAPTEFIVTLETNAAVALQTQWIIEGNHKWAFGTVDGTNIVGIAPLAFVGAGLNTINGYMGPTNFIFNMYTGLVTTPGMNAGTITASGTITALNIPGSGIITNNHNSSVNFDASLTVNSLVVDAGAITANAGITGNGSFTLNGNLIYPRLVLTASTNFTTLAMVSNTWFFCDVTSGNQSNVFGSSASIAANNLGGLAGIKWFSSSNLTGQVILDGGTTTFQFTDTGTRYLTLNCPFTVGIQLNKIIPNPRASVIGGNVWPQVTAGTVTGAVVRSGDGFTGSATNAVAYYAGGIVTNAASLPEPTGTANVTHTSTNWVLATWYTNSGTCAQVSVGARQTPTAAAAGVELRVTVKGSSVTNIYAPAYIGALAGADRVAMLAAPIGTNDVFAFIDTGSSASTLTNGMYDLVGCGAVGPIGATGPAGSEVLPTTLLSGQTVSQTISLGRSAMYAFTNALTTNQVWSFTSATNGADVSVDVTYASTTTNTIKLVPASGMTLNLYSTTNSLSVSNLPAFFSLDVGQTNRVSFGGGVTVQ